MQDIVGSKMPEFASDASKKSSDNTKTGYAQNGYQGASSDTDLSNPTRSALAVTLPPVDPAVKSPQTRDLSDKSDGNRAAAPLHPDMKRQTAPSKVGDVTVGTLPATLGASAAPQPTAPLANGNK
jgi:hypothetical protein